MDLNINIDDNTKDLLGGIVFGLVMCYLMYLWYKIGQRFKD